MNIFTVARLRRALFALLGALLIHIAIVNEATAQTEPSPPTAPPTVISTDVTAEPTALPVELPPGDARFGVIESYEDPSAAGRLGIGWTRVRFHWADVQPAGPDDWQPPIDDETLAAELDAGREVVGLLIGIPEWARDRRDLPRGLSLPFDDPDNTWAVFVDEIVTRYAGCIDRWIIWNESDIDDREAPGHTWDGTIEEFFLLQRTAYLTAKAANPGAVIHLGAFTYFWDPGYFARFLDVVADDPDAPANNYYFDVATAHLYFQPNSVYNVLYAFRRMMAAHGLEQPIWLVETNAPPMNDPYWMVDNWTLSVTLNEQAAFIPQAIAAAMAAGADRIAVYKLKDTAGDRAANPEPFGLLRWDDSRRPAFDTYRIAIRLMGGVSAAERKRWDEVAQVRLDQHGQSTTVMFARLPGPQVVRVRATAATAELVDMWGKRETVEADDGYFSVELPGALCTQTIADFCMIGGTTYYLIQEDDGQLPPDEELPRSDDPGVPEEGTPQSLPTRLVSTPEPANLPATEASTAPKPSQTMEPPTTTPPPTPAFGATTAHVSSSEVGVTLVAEVAVMDPVGGEARSPAVNNYIGLILIGLALLLGLGLISRLWVNRQ